MTKKTSSDIKMDDREWDDLLQSSLMIEESPPPAVQGALITQIRNSKPAWNLPWWMPAVVGGLQTTGVIAIAQIFWPGTVLAGISFIGGGAFIASACLLSGVIRYIHQKKEGEHSWY